MHSNANYGNCYTADGGVNRYINVNPTATPGSIQHNGTTQTICVGSTISSNSLENTTNGGAGTLTTVWYVGEDLGGGTWGNWRESTLGGLSGTTSSTALNTAAGGGAGTGQSLSSYNPQVDFPGKTRFLVIRRGYNSNCGPCVGGCQDQSFILELSSGPSAIATTPSPINAATGVCYAGIGTLTQLTWAAVAGASGYDVYGDATTNPPTTLLSSNQAGTSFTLPTLAANTIYYWRIAPRNACGVNNGGTVWSFTTANNPCGYCTPSFPSGAEPICNVTFNTINNSTSCTTGGNQYSDQTNISTTVVQGSSQSISVSGNTAGNFVNYINVFIDFNQNGVFDAGEEFQIGTISNCNPCATTGTITIPSGATLGNTRMRVVKRYNVYGSSCNSAGYGEAEDYTLTIAAPCTAPATQALNITAGSITASSAGISWSNGNGGGRVVYINSSNSFTAPANGSNPTATTAWANAGQQCIFNGTTGPVTVTGLLAGTTYWIRVYEYCTPGRTYQTATATNNPNSFTTQTLCQAATNITCGTSYTASLNSPSNWNVTCSGFASAGQEAVYTFTPSVTGNYTLATSAASGGFVNYFFKQATACDNTGWTCFGYTNTIATVGTISLTAGVQYYILLDGQSTGARSQTFSFTAPAQPSAITGTLNPEIGTSQTYFVTNVSDVTYTWSFPASWSITGGQGTNSVIVTVGTQNGTISVTPSNGCGNGTARTATTTIPQFRAKFISADFGSASWCTGISRTVLVTVKNDGVNTWTNSGPDINIGVKWNGWSDYHVRTDANNLASGQTQTYSLTIEAKNATAGPAYGTNLSIGSNNLTFDIVNEGNCWFVANSGLCGPGNSVYNPGAITITDIPAQPSAIAGATAPCVGSSQTYSVTNVSGVTYAWSLPSGWTGSSSTNSIAVTVGSGSGSITVTPSNSCGNGTTRTLAVAPVNQPSNDACASSTGLTIGAAAVTGNVSCAAAGSGACTGIANYDVWYSFTPACSGNHRVTVTGSASFDPVLQVYSSCGGSPINNTSSASCIDASGSGGTETSTYAVVAGTTYYVRVYDYEAAGNAYPSTSTFTISVADLCPPANDVCASAVNLTVNAAATSGTIANATAGPGACVGNIDYDVWYRFTTGSCGGAYTVFLDPSAQFDGVFQLYSGNCSGLSTLAGANIIASNTDAIYMASGCIDFVDSSPDDQPDWATYNLNANTTYFVRVYDVVNSGTAYPPTPGFTIAVSSSVNAFLASANAGSDITTCTLPFGLTGSVTGTPQCGGHIGTNDDFDGEYGPFSTAWDDSRKQYLYRASDLLAAGVVAGNINSIGFYVRNFLSSQTMNGFTVKMKNTSTTDLNSFTYETGLTTAFSGSYAVSIAGLNTINLTTPFNWDGTSNLLIELCYDNSSFTSNNTILLDLVSYTGVRGNYDDGISGCSDNLVWFYDTYIPLIRFGQSCTPVYTWSGPGTITPNPSATPSVSSLGTYNLSVNLGGCNVTDQVVISSTTIPAIPTVSNNGPVCNGSPAQLTAAGLAPGGQVAVLSNTLAEITGNAFTGTLNNHTMEFWVKPNKTVVLHSQVNSGVSGNLSAPTTEYSFAIGPNQFGGSGCTPSTVGTGVSVGTNGIEVVQHGPCHFPVTLSYPITLSGWTHVAVVHNGNVPSLYVNGNLVKQGVASLYPTFPNSGTGYTYGYFAGSIDNVRVWNVARTSGEIQANMFLETPLSGTGLIGHYPYNGNVTALTGPSNTNNGATFTAADYYTYTWTGTSAPAAGLAETQTTGNLSSGTNNYTVVATNGTCPGTTSAATAVVVRPTPNATISGAATVCQNGTAPTVTFTNTTNLPITVSYNVNNGGTQTINVAASSTNSVTQPTSSNGTFIYNLEGAQFQAAPLCPSPPLSGSVAIVVNQAAMVDAGPDATICSSGGALTGTVLSGSASSVTWSVASGSLTPNATTLNPTYLPTINSGNITLTATTNDPDGVGPCAAGTDTKIITINEKATAVAGGDLVTCVSTPISVPNGQANATNFGNSYVWAVVAGNGSIASEGTLTPTYTPAPSDAGQTVTLELFTDDPDGGGPCPAVSDALDIQVDALPTTPNAGTDIFDCLEDLVVNLAGNTPSVGTGAWSGSATFAQGNTPNSTATVVSPGTYTFTWTITNGVCPPSSDNVNVSYNNPLPITMTNGATGSCVVNDFADHHIFDANNNIIASINSNGQNLGSVSVTVNILGSPSEVANNIVPGVCGNSFTAFMGRNFDIVPDNQPSTRVDVKLYFTDSEFTALQAKAIANNNGDLCDEDDDVAFISKVHVTKYPTGNGPGGPDGTYIENSGDDQDFGANYIQVGVSSFSSFYLHGSASSAPLPVELINFTATAINNEYIQLDWATALEINNDGFELQRSTDAQNWTNIAWINGNDNSTTAKFYSHNDMQVAQNITYYYRLKQIDNDGQFEYSNIVNATLTGSNSSFNVLEFVPNPTVDMTTLLISSGVSQDIKVVIYNSIGQEVQTGNHTLTVGMNQIKLDVNLLAAGTYMATVTSGNEVRTKRLVISR